jgi:hypothetical protein
LRRISAVPGAGGSVGRRLSADHRSHLYRRARELTSCSAVESEGLSFLVPTADNATGRKFFPQGSRKEMRALAAALRRLWGAEVEVARTTFVDVGANIGTAAVAALRAGCRSTLAYVLVCCKLSVAVRPLRLLLDARLIARERVGHHRIVPRRAR